MALAINGLGAVHYAMDALPEAEAYFEEYLAFQQESGDVGEQALTEPLYAAALLESGRLEEALHGRQASEEISVRRLDNGYLSLAAPMAYGGNVQGLVEIEARGAVLEVVGPFSAPPARSSRMVSGALDLETLDSETLDSKSSSSASVGLAASARSFSS